MPGPVVTTAARSGLNTPLRNAAGQFFVVGLAERGSTTAAVLLQSMQDYKKYFGTRQSYGYLYDSVKLYFDEGGDQVYAVRVVGAAATKGTISVNDRAVTPQPTLKFDAANAGAWSANVSVIVSDGTVTNTVNVTAQLADGSVVETYKNLANPAAVVSAFANSVLVKVTDLGSATVAPNNNPAAGTYVLTAGTDDRASVVATSYTGALALFNAEYGDGVVAIPGQGTAVHQGLIAHASANNRIAILSVAQGTAKSGYESAAATVVGTAGSEFAGLFGPWVQVSDGGSGTYTVPPDGYVAASRTRAILQEGVWRVPAGAIAVAVSITGLETYFDKADGDELDSAQVNVIRSISNTFRLYGWRSLSSDQVNYEYLNGRDVMNRLATQAVDVLQPYTFLTVDAKGQLLSKIHAALVGICSPMAAGGGLYAKYDANNNMVDPGYIVTVDSSNNTTASLANNQVNASVKVRVSPTAALIDVYIEKVGLTSALA